MNIRQKRKVRVAGSVNTAKDAAIKNLLQIPGVGVSIANDLWNIGIQNVDELKGKDPQALYDHSNTLVGAVQDCCLLYVFRGAVYFAETNPEDREPEKLKSWNWKNIS